jgi:hypothetical protein
MIVAVGAFLNEPFTGQYLLGGLSTIVALFGILLILRREGAGLWGTLGILTALMGNLFFAIEQYYALAGVLYGGGLVLLAIGARKTDVFPRWLPALWILAPLIGLPGLVLTGAAAFLSTVATVVFGVAFIAAGYVLWTATAPTPAQPST